jgi:hypothetical protein
MDIVHSAQFVGIIGSSIMLFWAVYRQSRSSKPVTFIFWGPLKLMQVSLIILAFGFLSACSNPDPLAVASGPVFQLNSGHWQPSPQDLAGPPAVTNP